MFAGKGANPDASDQSDDEFRDDASYVSDASAYWNDTQANSDEEGGGGGAGEDAEQQFEDKLAAAMDSATQKSATGRVTALKNLCRGLRKRLVPDFLEDR